MPKLRLQSGHTIWK